MIAGSQNVPEDSRIYLRAATAHAVLRMHVMSECDQCSPTLYDGQVLILNGARRGGKDQGVKPLKLRSANGEHG